MITENTQTSQGNDDDFDFNLDVSDSDPENDSEVGSILRKGNKFAGPEECVKFMQGTIQILRKQNSGWVQNCDYLTIRMSH